MKKIIFLLGLIAILLVACKQDPVSTEQGSQDLVDQERLTDKDSSKDSSNAGQDDTSQVASGEDQIDQGLDGLSSLLTQETDPDILGLYIKDHIISADVVTADAMLEWLLIYQTELIKIGNEQSYSDAFLEALNQDMDYTFDPTKIKAVKNPETQALFQAFADANLTIIRYEETPVIETDWEAMAQFIPYVSEELAYVLQMNRENRHSLGTSYQAYADSITQVEGAIETYKSPFALRLLRDLHSRMVSNLLIGPEGSFVSTFIEKSGDPYTGDIYDELMVFAEGNENTGFGQFILRLNQADFQDYTGPLDLINQYISFGYASAFTWENTTFENEKSNGNLLSLYSEKYPQAADQVNEIITSKINALTDSLNLSQSYSISMYTNYTSTNYTSLSIYISYLDENGAYAFLEASLNFSMPDGDLLELEAYLGVPLDSLPNVLYDLSGYQYSFLPDYQIGYNGGIYLKAKPEDAGIESYIELTPKKLSKYIPLELLY